MLETKEQKQIFGAAVLVIVILVIVSLSHKASFLYKDVPRKSTNQQEYTAYLNSLQIDPVASKNLYEDIISQDQVTQEAEDALSVSQKIEQPKIADSALHIVAKSTVQNVTSYFKTHVLLSGDLKQSTTANSQLFLPGGDSTQVTALEDKNNQVLSQYYAIAVPSEAVPFQKAQLASLTAYADLIKIGKAYMADQSTNPWPELYKDYSIINDQTATALSEYAKLDKKYAITQSLNDTQMASSMFMPTAQALVPVVDVKQISISLFQEALASGFAQFASAFLEKLITQIESNYKIANFLYYTDALVNGQYVDDYLNKYVQGSLDKAMVKNFIPQFNCGSPQDMKTVFKAKAGQYLGFDPETVSPNDPDYFSKMAKVGNFLSSPSGWDLYYQDVAEQAQAQAEKSANNELTSSGLKTSRDDTGAIASAVSSVNASLHSAMQSYFDLGVSNSRSTVGKLVGGLLQQFMGKFVFKGAVLKEQQVCLSVPEVKPVVPGANVVLPPDPITPTEQQVDQQYEPRGGP